ncbi:MAG: serine protease [Planctomycetota bacterium]
MKRFSNFVFALSISLTLSACVYGQVGQETELWQWTESATHHEAIVEVSSGGGIGTGVIISIDEDKPIKDGHEGYCLTAWHVVQDDNNQGEIRIRFSNGRKSKGCRVVQYDESRDVALVWVWVPEDIEPARLATEEITSGDSLELAGLGGGSSIEGGIRHFSAVASPPSNPDKIFADVSLLPGDSGGPVFNADQEVVGIISGGWFWYDSGVKTESGSEIKTTWPARASNVGPIHVMLENVRGTNIAEATTTLDR